MKNTMTQMMVLLAVALVAIGCKKEETVEVKSAQAGAELTAPEVQGKVVEGGSGQIEVQLAADQVQGMVVDAACGTCKFGLEGSRCDLAVRIEGKAYMVDGAKMSDHGNAHAADGMCSMVRQATVQGSVENGRFVATSFSLLPIAKE